MNKKQLLEFIARSISRADITGLLDFLRTNENEVGKYTSLYRYLTMFSPEKRKAPFARLFKFIGVDIRGKRFLDFGPGSGESLDVAKELGAKEVMFLDRDIIIHKYNTLRGYRGVVVDYTRDGWLDSVGDIGKFDFVLLRGSINADVWETGKISLPFGKFLSQVEGMVNPRGTIVLTPAFARGEEIDGRYYTCMGEKKERFMRSAFVRTLTERNYNSCFIDGYGDRYNMPITFVKMVAP